MRSDFLRSSAPYHQSVMYHEVQDLVPSLTRAIRVRDSTNHTSRDSDKLVVSFEALWSCLVESVKLVG